MNPTPTLESEAPTLVENLALPVSALIRARLRAADRRFRANDNIASSCRW